MPRGDSGDDRKPRFKYRGRSEEEVSRRAKQSSGNYDSMLPNDVIMYKPGAGENSIRILPWNINPDNQDELAEKWGDHWGIDIHLHYNVGPDEQSYLCLDKMKGEPCPVCEARRTGTDEEADQLRISSRILCWLIDRNDEKAGPKLWSMPLGVSNDISAASQVKGSRGGGAEDGKVLQIDNPDEGFDVFFDKEGEKIKTKYKRVEVSRDPTPIHEDEKKQDRWLAYIADNPLPELLVYYDAEHIEKVLFGQSERAGSSERSSRRGGRGDDETEETTSRPGRRSREPEPEEEVEAPRGRARGRGAKDEEGDQPEGERSGRRGSRRGEPEPEAEETSQDHDHEADEARASKERGVSRHRGAEKEPEPESPRGGRRRGVEPEVEEEGGGSGGRAGGRRRGGEEPSEEEGSAEGARGRLARLGSRGRR